MFASQQQLHNNTVYPLLGRFLKNGWITQREADGERGQTRLLYELTDAGRAALVEKLNDFSESDAANEHAFRLRVGLFGELKPADRERILHLRDKFLAVRAERMSKIAGAHVLQGWPALTFEFVASELALERKWIAELLTRIEEN